MRKIKILCAVLLLTTMFSLASCNRGMTDFNYKFDYAYVYCGNNLIAEGTVEKWWDYENSDMVQVKIDGKVYLTHSANVILVGG